MPSINSKCLFHRLSGKVLRITASKLPISQDQLGWQGQKVTHLLSSNIPSHIIIALCGEDTPSNVIVIISCGL